LINVGEGTNIQEGAVLHTDPGFPLSIGEYVTIGHRAIVHGCTIGDGSLVGMGATIMNGVKVGRDSLVGANALLTEGKEFPERSLIIGAPAKVVGQIGKEVVESLKASAANYVQDAERFRSTLRLIR
jgi:carbonic anhydrase/acetyltransferase-like protein (isoleucine patch superfamily)